MRHYSIPKFFPPAEEADPDGLLGFGGELSPEWLIDAYRHGIFPWPFGDETYPVAWWSPDPRAIIELDAFHVPRRLRRTLRSGKFEVTCNQDFFGVIQGCATAGDRNGNTWITPRLLDAYVRLHRLGKAHSIEVWQEGKLVGGTYGVALGAMFAGESKFHVVRDASKVALVYLVAHLINRGYQLFDIQQRTEHSIQFGSTEIPRTDYLQRLAIAVDTDVTFGDRLETHFPGVLD